MKLLLTGGSGFIGRNLLESPLAGKYEILAPGHAELDLLDSAAVADYFAANAISCVIHSALKPSHRNAKDPSALFYSNTRMFFNLAANSGSFRKMLVIGSGSAYDMKHYRPKMAEEYFGRHIPADELGFGKYVCGKYIENSSNIIDLRVFGLYGKYEDYAIRFISNMICKAVCGLPLTIKQNRRFDYIHVDDLVPVLDYFLTHEAGHTAYNVTPDSAAELKALAELVLKISGKQLPIEIAVPEMGPEYSGDNSRIKAEMGAAYRPAPLESSVAALYAWYSRNSSAIDRAKLAVDK